jgi:hypothetical protein
MFRDAFLNGAFAELITYKSRSGATRPVAALYESVADEVDVEQQQIAADAVNIDIGRPPPGAAAVGDFMVDPADATRWFVVAPKANDEFQMQGRWYRVQDVDRAPERLFWRLQAVPK